MCIKKTLLMALMFVCMVAGIMTGRTDVAKAEGNQYYIKVNKSTNVVTVYKSDGTPYKAFVCSTGGATPVGTFYTKQKMRWHVLMGPSYGQYCTRIVDGILFHSVWYYQNGNKASQSTVQYNRLGTTASHGCVRLTVADSKWIYDNCPTGTKVIIFNGSSKDDPLGKPKPIVVSTASRMGWDPTDPDPSNPYLKKEPVITTESDTYTVKYGESKDLGELAQARAAYGTDLNSKMAITVKAPGAKKAVKFTGKTYKFSKVGTYTVTYKVTDPKNDKSSSATVKIEVEDTGKPIISGVTSKRTVSYGTSLDLKSKVKVATASGTDLKSKLVVTITGPSGKKIKLKDNSYTFKKLGKFKITFSAKSPVTSIQTTKSITITVKDTKAPTFSGITNATKEYKSTFNVKSGVKAKTTTGASLTSKINITVTDPSGNSVKITNNKITLSKKGTYKIKYTVKGTNNLTATKTRTVKSQDTGTPVLSGVPVNVTNVTWKQAVDIRKGIKAVTSKGTSFTSSIVITVKDPKGNSISLQPSAKVFTFNSVGTYTIKYSVKNNITNKTAQKTCKYAVKYNPNIEAQDNVNINIADGTTSYSLTDNVKTTSIHDKKTSLEKVINYSYKAEYQKAYEDGSVTEIPVVNGKINVNNPGIYKVKYTVSGTNVIVKSKTVTITVADLSNEYSVNSDGGEVYEEGADINLVGTVHATTKAGTDISKVISLSKVYIIDEQGNRNEVAVSGGKLMAAPAGAYVAVYSISDKAKNYFAGLITVEYAFVVNAKENDIPQEPLTEEEDVTDSLEACGENTLEGR